MYIGYRVDVRFKLEPLHDAIVAGCCALVRFSGMKFMAKQCFTPCPGLIRNNDDDEHWDPDWPKAALRSISNLSFPIRTSAWVFQQSWPQRFSRVLCSDIEPKLPNVLNHFLTLHPPMYIQEGSYGLYKVVLGGFQSVVGGCWTSRSQRLEFQIQTKSKTKARVRRFNYTFPIRL